MSVYIDLNKTLKISPKNSLKRDVLIYSVLFLAAAFACYIFFILEGKTFVKYTNSNADGLTQTYTAYVALKHMIQNVFAGDGIPAWSWNLGLGADTFEYYGFKLFNPLTYFIIAFPERLIDVGYSIANILREYLAGFTFLLCMREVKLERMQRIAGAIAYAFCGWMVELVLNQGSFENIGIIFPLLILGTEKFLKEKKSTLFIVSVLLCITTGVTWTYICGIIIPIYYLVRYHDYHKGEPAKEFFKTTAKYIGNGLLGIIIGYPFVTAMIASMGGATTDTGAQTNLWAYTLKKYISIPEGLFKYEEVGALSYSYICMSVLCVALIPMLIYSLRKKSTIAWIATVLAVLSLLPITSKVLNGFSYPAGRWYFVLMFFAIWATTECLNKEILSDKKNLWTMASWLILLAAIIGFFYVEGLTTQATAIAVAIEILFGMMLILLAYLYFYRGKTNNLILTVASLILIAGLALPVAGRTCPYIANELGDYLSVGESYKLLQTSTERVAPKLSAKDDSFYRTDQAYRANPKMKTKLKTNANIVYNNKSVYMYSSIIDSRWSKFNKVLGNNLGYFSRMNVVSNDNRAPIDYLLGVKYFLGDNKDEKNASKYAGYGYEKSGKIDGVTIHKNKHCIGLGTVMNKYITESELMEYPELVRDQVMLQAAVVADDQVDLVKGVRHAKKSEIKTSIYKLDAKRIAGKNVRFDKKSFVVTHGKGFIKLKIPEVKNAQIVVSLEGLEREPLDYDTALAIGAHGLLKPKTEFARKIESLSYVDKGNFWIKLRSKGIKKFAFCEKDSPRGFVDVKDYNINMGRAENLGKTIKMKFSEVGKYNFKSIKVYAIPMDVLNKQADKLERRSFKLDGAWDDKHADIITGRVKARKDSILYLSIPEGKGWFVSLDDSDGETTITTNIAFTGVKISQGEHELWLEYKSRSGDSVITLICGWIGALIGFTIRKRVIEKDIDDTEKILEEN